MSRQLKNKMVLLSTIHLICCSFDVLKYDHVKGSKELATSVEPPYNEWSRNWQNVLTLMNFHYVRFFLICFNVTRVKNIVCRFHLTIGGLQFVQIEVIYVFWLFPLLGFHYEWWGRDEKGIWILVNHVSCNWCGKLFC